MRQLACLLRHDLVLQARSFLYPATAVSTGIICAFILLMIIVFVLNIVFWWIPFFKICFPLNLKTS